MYVLSTAGAQDFPPVFVNPDSDSGDWIDVYENEMSGVYIYTMSVDDPDFLDIHTYRYKFVSWLLSNQLSFMYMLGSICIIYIHTTRMFGTFPYSRIDLTYYSWCVVFL